MTLAAPMNEVELRNMMFTASRFKKGPFAIRYPRGYGFLDADEWKQEFQKLVVGKGRQLSDGEEVAIISLGQPGSYVLEACRQLETEGFFPAIYDLRFLKPIDKALLHEIFSHFKKIITIEDGVLQGGLASSLSAFATRHHYANHLETIGISDEFIPHGSKTDLYKYCGMDVEGIKQKIRKIVTKTHA